MTAFKGVQLFSREPPQPECAARRLDSQSEPRSIHAIEAGLYWQEGIRTSSACTNLVWCIRTIRTCGLFAEKLPSFLRKERTLLLIYADQAFLDGNRHSFRPVFGVQLCHQADHVISCRFVADKKDGTDLFVGQAFGHKLQDFRLTRA